ncbi:MAG TPA: peptidoglycan-binding domain-containing protein [Chthoniobacterales bacterium]|jgi:hypothetical protein
MKKLTLPFLTLACLAFVFTAPAAEAKDKDKKKDKKRRANAERVVVVRDGDRRTVTRYDNDRRDGDRYDRDRREVVVDRRVVVTREYADDGRDYRNRRGDFSYRSRYPRRVVVYEDRPYGYNYYDLQVVLRREGYYRGPLDGIWGPGSRAALVSYQSNRGWRRDGEVDGRLIVNFGLGY